MHIGRKSWMLLLVTFLVMARVNADVGDMNTMKYACESSAPNLKKLCQIVSSHFKVPQDSYVHLGKEFYLVSAPNTGRVAQGIYAVNTNTDQIVMFGGYGLPEFGGIIRQSSGNVLIAQSQMSMAHGHYWEAEAVLQVRTNPISKTPYVISQQVSVLIDASDELSSYCRNQNHKQHPDCTEQNIWGKLHKTRSNDISSRKVLKAHVDALAAFKHKRIGSKQPFKILEDAGVRAIVDKKPKDMTLHQYVNVLNDYAFFAYEYGEGRNEFAIEILDKVIMLSPDRIPAYLNMSQALEHLAKFGASEYTSMPLGHEDIVNSKRSAELYLEIYKSMKSKRK